MLNRKLLLFHFVMHLHFFLMFYFIHVNYFTTLNNKQPDWLNGYLAIVIKKCRFPRLIFRLPRWARPLRRCFVSSGGALSTGCSCMQHSSFGCVPPLDTSPLASVGRPPQALTLFGGVEFIARRLRRPEKGNANGVRGIFGTACRVGLRLCDRTNFKNRFVPHSYAGGA